jgi:hypothetical protein
VNELEKPLNKVTENNLLFPFLRRTTNIESGELF